MYHGPGPPDNPGADDSRTVGPGVHWNGPDPDGFVEEGASPAPDGPAGGGHATRDFPRKHMKPQRSIILGLAALAAGLVASVPGRAPAKEADDDPQIGESFRVPYRLTLTNHYLVRVRVDGKGPFNFLVDTGAPAVFVGTEAAKAAGIEADSSKFWTKLETLEFEGGAVLRDLNVRVEDPFQLVGMNALGLPGASIDGILGYTALARFRMEFDPTNDRMTWTRLDFTPKDPYVPKDASERIATPEVQMMSLLGPAMKFASMILGKQPEGRLAAPRSARPGTRHPRARRRRQGRRACESRRC